jgi:hypothetical protein
LVGPFVGFHHQSLLISALWPEGRGNIAYGSNVGSNHTGKKPDQEIRPGEGNFFGLGCSIKFPANFEDAPYSLIATGVITAPQKLDFPFSLINTPVTVRPELGSSYNEIVPGWMWSENVYALARRSYKCDGDSGLFSGRLFTPQIADKALKALHSLRSLPTDLAYYVEERVPGLGKNFLRRENRDKAVKAYEDYLVFFLLSAYASQPAQAWPTDVKDTIGRIDKELGIEKDVKTFLGSQVSRLEQLRASVLRSLERDDRRGREVFEDYGDFHPASAADATVIRLGKDLDDLFDRLRRFLESH